MLSTSPLKNPGTCFCPTCFQTEVLAEIQKYDDLVEQARQIHVFMKKQTKETRLIPRIEKPVKVVDCKDEEEVMMRLAIMAVQKNKNCLVDMDIVGKKVKDGSYSTHIFSGSAIPAEFNDKRIVRDRSLWQNPN